MQMSNRPRYFMMSKRGKREGSLAYRAHHVLRGAEGGKGTVPDRIIQLRLSDEQLETFARIGGGRICFGTKTIQVSGDKWPFDLTEEHKTGSHLELFQVSEVGSTVYESVGAVSGKITLKGSISGSVKAKIQKKSQDKAQQKKDSAATQLDGGGSSSKKKRSAVSEPVGAQSPKRIKEAGKDASLKVAVDTISEMEKKDKVLHSLAVRDMSKADLRARIGNRDIPRAILQEFATWDPQKSHYILKRHFYANVDTSHASYSASERAIAMGRKAAMAPMTPVSVSSEDDARAMRQRYVSSHGRYVEVDKELQEMLREFEGMGDELRKSNKSSKGKDSASWGRDVEVADRIDAAFVNKREELMAKHGEFMRLHGLLLEIKIHLEKWNTREQEDGANQKD